MIQLETGDDDRVYVSQEQFPGPKPFPDENLVRPKLHPKPGASQPVNRGTVLKAAGNCAQRRRVGKMQKEGDTQEPPQFHTKKVFRRLIHKSPSPQPPHGSSSLAAHLPQDKLAGVQEPVRLPGQPIHEIAGHVRQKAQRQVRHNVHKDKQDRTDQEHSDAFFDHEIPTATHDRPEFHLSASASYGHSPQSVVPPAPPIVFAGTL
jgi:hypothetical protein